MTAFHIRPAMAGDAPGATETLRAAYAPYRARGIALPPVEEGVAEAIAETPVFVAQSGADIAGVIVLRIGTDHLQVENLAVHPAASGTGIATALLQQAERVARQRGLATLRLATHSALARTIGLYRHLGWTNSETSGPKVMMEKPVSPD